MMPLRLVLADDQPEILTLLQTVLEPQYQIVATAQDGFSLLAAARAFRPDVVLTDIDMPRLNGIDAAKQLREALPHCRVIFHTSHGDPDLMAQALAAGAAGYLIKGSSASLVSSIRSVIEHVCYHGEGRSPNDQRRLTSQPSPTSNSRHRPPPHSSHIGAERS